MNANSESGSRSCNSISIVHYHQSMPNISNNVINRLLSWRKSKRSKAFKNVCVLMKNEQINTICTRNETRSNCLTEYLKSHSSLTPVVSFVNKGDGIISMQL